LKTEPGARTPTPAFCARAQSKDFELPDHDQTITRKELIMKTKEKSNSRSHTGQRSESSAHAATAHGTELFDQAVRSCEQTLRTAVRLQEDAAKWWTNVLNQTTWPQEWQKQVRTVVSEAIPTAQKNLEDSLRLVDQCSKTGLDLLRKAVDGSGNNAANNAQCQVQELWQSSLGVIQSNLRAVTESQARMMESWGEFVRKGVASTAEAASR
jgi:hypothetical protein